MKMNYSFDDSKSEEQLSQLHSIASYRRGLLSELEKAVNRKNYEEVFIYASMLLGKAITKTVRQDKGNDQSAGVSQGVNPRPKQ